MKKWIYLLLWMLLAAPLARGQAGRMTDIAQDYADGKYLTALSGALSVTRSDPDNDAAWYYAGIARFALEHNQITAVGDAADYLRKAVALDSANYWYRDRLAAIYLMRGEKELAIQAYETLLRDFPKRTDASYQLVNLYLQGGDNDKALQMIDEIESTAGKNDPTVMTRYRILLQQQKQEEALEVLRDYCDEYASPQVLTMLGDHQMGMFNDSLALDYYNEALALDKDFAPALLGKSEAYRMTRRYPDFFQTLNRLMDNPEAQPVAKTDYLVEVLRRSDPRFIQNFRPQLDTVWQTMLARHPNDSSVVTGAGIWYFQTNRLEPALALFKGYAQAHPEAYGSTVTYLQLLGSAEAYDEMIAAAEEAYRRFPEKVNLLEFVTMAQYNQKNYAGVVATAERMIAAAPKDSAVCLSAYSTIGDMQHLLKQEEKSFKAYKKALKINPDYAPVLNNYAYYLSMKGRQLPLAAKMASQAVRQEPDNATYLDTFGWILHLQGKDVEAKPLFKHAMLYGGKESAVILMHYAIVLEALGENDLAKIYRNQAKSKAGNEEEE